jgi:hypothetical protein
MISGVAPPGTTDCACGSGISAASVVGASTDVRNLTMPGPSSCRPSRRRPPVDSRESTHTALVGTSGRLLDRPPTSQIGSFPAIGAMTAGRRSSSGVDGHPALGSAVSTRLERSRHRDIQQPQHPGQLQRTHSRPRSEVHRYFSACPHNTAFSCEAPFLPCLVSSCNASLGGARTHIRAAIV